MLILYIFIMEMKTMQIKVVSETVEEYRLGLSAHKSNKIYIYLSYVLIQAGVVTLQYIRKSMPYDSTGEQDKDLLNDMELIENILRGLKLLIDFYMFYLYMRLVHFFALMKSHHLR
jgi:hypothetical protein